MHGRALFRPICRAAPAEDIDFGSGLGVAAGVWRQTRNLNRRISMSKRAREEAPVADTVADNGEKLIDGKRMAETIRAEIAAEVPKVSLGPVAGSVQPCRPPQFFP